MKPVKKLKFRIKKGDEVVVITGSELGKKWKVLQVLQKNSSVLVQGVNLVKRHTKQSQTSQGGILEKESPMHVSNVSLVYPKLGKPSKIGFKFFY